MLRALLLSILLFLLAGQLFADTTWVTDTLLSWTYWDRYHSPYMITHDMTVPPGGRFSLGAGTKVYFTGPYRFTVRGRLYASGTTPDSIRFTTDTLTNPDRWRGIHFYASDSSMMSHCVIEFAGAVSPDTSLYGGGIEIRSDFPTISQCTFRHCRATSGGGGVSVVASPPMTFWGCKFEDNSAPRGGGGFDSSSTVTYINCLMAGNQSSLGGALYTGYHSHDALTYSTLVNNISPTAAVYCENNYPTINSTLVAGNTPGAAMQFASPLSASLTYNDVWNNAGGSYSGDVPPGIGVITRTNRWGDSSDASFNVSLDPRFVNPDSANFRLNDFSRCIGAGDSLNYPHADLDNLSRPQPWGRSIPDVGAYENHDSGPLQFWSGTIGPGTILNYGDAIVSAGDTLILLPGTHIMMMSPSTFRVNGTLLALGTAQDSVGILTDTLLNPGRWNGLVFSNTAVGCSLAFCRVAFGDTSNIRVTGCSPAFWHCLIDNGRVPWAGAGVNLTSSCSHFNQCAFRYNVAADSGGAVHCRTADSAPVFTGCEFSGNRVTVELSRGGGAFFGSRSQATFSGCTFIANHATYGGGILIKDTAVVTMTGCTFTGNSGSYGAGINCSTNSIFEHCLLYDNGAAYGCAMWLSSRTAQVQNCTIVHNFGPYGEIVCYQSSPVISSSIIGYGAPASGIYFYQSPAAQIRFCDFVTNSEGNFVFNTGPSDGPPNIGTLVRTNSRGDSADQYLNVSLGPLFVNYAGHDYHLTALSHCIDAGDSALPRDSDGTITDIGTFYFPRVNHPPSAFTLAAPANGAYLPPDSTANFAWHRSFDPDYWDTLNYALHLSAPDSAFSFVSQPDTLHTLQLSSLGLPIHTTVHWWVLAHSLSPDTFVSSDTFRFTLGAPGHPPSSFTLIAPANDSVLTEDSTVAFVWHPSFDPDSSDTLRYSFHLSTPDSMLSVTALADTALTLNLHPLSIPNDSTVRWWVQAHSQYPDTTISSDTLRFTLRIPNRAADGDKLPKVFALHPAFPNPFNPAATLSFSLPRAGNVKLRVFDITGRLVQTLAERRFEAGEHSLRFDGSALPSGIYFARLQSGGLSRTQKIVLLK